MWVGCLCSWVGCLCSWVGWVGLLDLRGGGDGGDVLPCYITYLDLGDGGCLGDVLHMCVCASVCVSPSTNK